MEEVIEYDDYSHTMSGVLPGPARAARLSDAIYDSIRLSPGVVSSGSRVMPSHASRTPAAGMQEF